MSTCMSVSLVMFQQMTEIIQGLRKKYVWSVVDQYNRSFQIRIKAYFKIRLRSIRLYNEDISIFRSSSQDVIAPKNLSESCYDLMKINDSITVNFVRYCHSKIQGMSINMNYLSLLYDDMNERLDSLKDNYVRTVKAIS